MLTISTFKNWYMKQPSSTDGAATAATDDDLLFFVRNNVDKVGGAACHVMRSCI